MADNDRITPIGTAAGTSDEKAAGTEENNTTPLMAATAAHPRARPDPETGEFRAGPGDAGLEGRPVVNAGTTGARQMSNRRLGIGLAVGALLTVLAFIFAALF